MKKWAVLVLLAFISTLAASDKKPVSTTGSKGLDQLLKIIEKTEKSGRIDLKDTRDFRKKAAHFISLDKQNLSKLESEYSASERIAVQSNLDAMQLSLTNASESLKVIGEEARKSPPDLNLYTQSGRTVISNLTNFLNTYKAVSDKGKHNQGQQS
ncbi:MAG: hypothetical protein PHW04_15230 [Candidatus Wallbacteria bacterium]|nr:hypothetical protein [Candidatus Wallbacteria bacterium]